MISGSGPAFASTPPTERGGEYRLLIHHLNQRYRQEHARAERLADELRDIRSSRAWRILAWLRAARRGCLLLFSRQRELAPAIELQVDAPPLQSGPAASVSIIIPFRDHVPLLRNCLASLNRTTHRRFEVILVDNGSQEPSTKRFLNSLGNRRRWRVASCPIPFNFAALCNFGARLSRGEYLLFLNNDTEAINADWLGHMLDLTAGSNAGVVGATLLYPDGTVQHAGMGQQGGHWVHLHRGRAWSDADDGSPLRTVRSVAAVTGACLMIRRKLFHELGGFDERLPLTHNDVDLCQRVRQLGLQVLVTPHARLLHYESLSRGYSGENEVA